MLGIVVGVGAVIAMVAIGQGASAQVQAQIASLGSNLLSIQPGSNNIGGVRNGWGNAQTLSSKDAQAIYNEIPSIANVGAAVRDGTQVIFGNNNWYARVEGVTVGYLDVRNFQVATGRPFTQQEDDMAARVALVGPTVIKEVFGGVDPIGQQVRLGRAIFTVIGTLAAKGQAPDGDDQDDAILIPLTTAKRKLLGRNWAAADSVRNIYVSARSPELVPVAMQQIEALLRQRHQLLPGEDNDFQIRNLTERYEVQEESAQVMTLLLAAIASVSLLVGGIGIMNIMLVSVTERTKEIGLRQAVGAKTGDILSQFLVESVTLSLAGGVAGILLGIGASELLTAVAGWSTIVSEAAIVGAFAFSALVGIFFGYYPARKAAFLDPIEALRYE